ncbi:MauE/DoxX family redox-associated membrane protein [Azohydromonas caseinilytica]|uniref:Methylamine utilization protein MauE n=1 Tax=Azohydromonas caseinilytica TaxID=2728836 RepID=A0A848FHW3_9BURK|nr:MauE/DoxX family redox-associated membrane protein [Azohydromonas caseinilytica]NML17853.1 methylamine utilization protein MauE [Azohydromonas caseinilytica]
MGAALPFALDPVLGHAAAATLGAVLLLGAISKLRDLALFRGALDNHRLLPRALLAPAALLLPLLELVAGALRLPTASRESGALLGLAVLVLVTGAVVINLRRGRERIDCGCGGSEHVPLSRGLVARNAGLALLALVALAPAPARATVWLDLAATAFATLFLLGLVLAVNQLLSNQPRFGRRYISQVLLPRVSSPTLPAGLRPYDGEEIARLRRTRPADVGAVRQQLLGQGHTAGIAIEP